MLFAASLLLWRFWPGASGRWHNFPPSASGPWVAFGDSLTAGYGSEKAGADYPTQLGQRLGVPIQNLGVPGETSADGASNSRCHAAVSSADHCARMEPAEPAEPAVTK